MSSSRKLSEYTIVQDLAESVFERVKSKTIKMLDAMEGGYSGDSSGLSSLWEELCVQVQHEQSIDWRSCEMITYETVEGLVEELAPFEREALWLLTDEGSDWECDDEQERASYPVNVSEIVKHVVENGIYEAAAWSTKPGVLQYLRRKLGCCEEVDQIEHEDADG